MGKRGALVVSVFLALAASRADAQRLAPPADFKLVVATYGLRKAPIESAEIVVHHGRAYQFVSGPSLEVIIHDPATAGLELIDLDRKLRTEVSFKKLDANQGRLHDAIRKANVKRRERGGRANEVAAAMGRDLIDPRFQATYDPSRHHLRLTNATVEVEASGTPESDRSRLALIASTLAAFAKLGALRDPEAIPPFARLEALRALTAEHPLRPSELTILYRLAGPPKKVRWTYTLEPALTTREIEALARVDTMMGRCSFARFEQYERRSVGGK